MTTTPAPSIAASLLTGSSTGPFPTGFKYGAAEDVRVWLELAGVRQPDLTLTTHYTLTGATPLVDGGTVTLEAGVVPGGGWDEDAGDRIVIARRTVKRQALALPDTEGHKPRSTEAALDKLMRVGEEQAAQLDLGVSVPPGEAGPTLPAQAIRDGGVAWFDGAAIRGFRLAAGSVLAADPETGALISVPPVFAVDQTPASVPTRFLALLTNFPATLAFIRTAGYLTVGDLGGALYRKVGSEPAHAGKFQSADGAWWELATHLVNVFMFGAVGDGVTDDTAACQAAIATGKNVLFPEGFTFAVTSLSGFANNRIYAGGGTIAKFGTTPAHLFILPDQSSGTVFDDLTFDGNRSAFTIGNAGAGIFGYLCRSLTVRKCTFRNLIDSGVKMRDGAFVTVTGSTFTDISENGVELRNYDADPRTGVDYAGGLTRPAIQGGHSISQNRFERITRIETDGGPIVDACGVTFDSIVLHALPAVRHRNVTVANNIFIDCLRGVFSENNYVGSEADGVLVIGNQFRSGVSGGPDEGVYSKVGAGFSGIKNAVIAGNTFLNPVTFNPSGSVTAGIILTASVGIANNANVSVRDNKITDDGSIDEGMEYGIYVAAGDGIDITGNAISGASVQPIYLHPSNAVNVSLSGNTGADASETWRNVRTVTFSLTGVPAGAVTDMLPFGLAGNDETAVETPFRIVGITATGNQNVGSNFTIVPHVAGLADTGVQLSQADFGGGRIVTKTITAVAAVQHAAGQRLSVKIITDGAATAGTNLAVTLTLETSFSR